MRTRAELAVATLTSARDQLTRNLRTLTLDEALQSAGGFRSIVGILKHTASWSHVYQSYAFDAQPRHMRSLDWPRGVYDTIETSQAYLDELVEWYEDSYGRWVASVEPLIDETFDEPRPCHWGATMPLFEIILINANHWCYHTGEVNAIMSILRGEAWEYTEEMEENHISTVGHRLRPDWMSAGHAAAWEAHLAKRDAELHGGGE
ncbi:MAG: DinB family protein [Dehalococcoidia bacterium]